MKKVITLLCACACLSACAPKTGGLIYDAAPIQLTTISNSVTATGTVEPIIQVEVGTQVSGIIDKIYVDYNSEVKQGQLIAEIDRSVLQAEVESSKANLDASQAEFDYEEINYNRQKGLYEKELISQSAFDDAQYSYSRAKFALTQAKSNYQKSQKNLGYTWIYSPINGVVLSRDVDEGQTVASGFSTPTLFTIAQDLREMQVIADVDEADIGEVVEGQRVTFTVDAYPDDKFTGSVIQVRLLATTTSNVVTYEVVINTPNPDLKLKPGLTANVAIYTLNKPDVLAVPVRALRFTPDNYVGDVPEICVWVMKEDGTLEPKAVTTGVSDGIYTEITSGVQVGDKVVTGTRLANPKAAGMPNMPGSPENAQGGSSSPFMPPRPNEGNNIRTK